MMLLFRLIACLSLVAHVLSPVAPVVADPLTGPAVAEPVVPAAAPVASLAAPNLAVQLAAGAGHVCALSAAGAVWCWGSNYFGQLGTGTTFSSTYLPTPVRGLPPVRAIAAGQYTTCAITTADDLYCWGRGELYALGNASTAVVTRPFKLLGGVRAVGLGWNHGCAALVNGGLQCWGRLAYQTPQGTARILGSQTPGDVIQPQASPILALTGGNGFECALLQSGEVACWGITSTIDFGSASGTTVPPTVVGTGFAALSGQTTHVCGVTTAGGVRCLGANGYGQAGRTPGAADGAFRDVAGAAGFTTGVDALTTGDRHTCGVDAGHGLWCWGDNSSAQLGRGRTGAPDAAPARAVALGEPVVQVAAAGLSTCALTASGKVFCWGSNSNRQTSARAYNVQVWPVRVPGFGPLSQGPVAITGIEVTQGIQNLSNDTPLVANRRTVVRVYARATTATSALPTVTLSAQRNGVELADSPLAPVNAVRVTTSGGDRLSLSGGFYFELPWTWTTAGALTLQVNNLSATQTCEDQTGAPGDCQATVTFESIPAAQLMIVGLPYFNATGALVAAPSLAQRRQAAEQILRVHPVPDVIWSTQDSAYIAPQPLGRDADDGMAMISEVALPLLQLRGSQGCSSPCSTVYMYLLADPPATGLDFVGVALTGQGVGMSYTHHPKVPSPGDFLLFAHEVAHAYGLNHAPCKGQSPTGTDPAFPDIRGRLDATLHTDHGFVGLDLTSRRLYDPTTSYDLMSYCTPGWLSNYNAELELALFRAGPDFPALTAAAGPSAQSTGDVLLVTGLIDATAHVATLEPVYDLPGIAASPAGASGAYTARLLDGAQNTLALVPLTVSATSDGSPTLLAFMGSTVRPAGLARLQILENGQVIGERQVSAHAPSVTLLSPSAGSLSGTVAVSWSATDADGDALHYLVQFSADGGATWTTLATGLTQTSLSVDTASLPGTSNGVVRVIASDGLLSASSTSGAWQLAGHSPTVTIAAPVAGSAFQIDSLIVAEASAYDLEDGSALPDGAYTWSTADGQPLAIGRAVSIPAAMLDPDDPQLRVTVQDAAGNIATDAIPVTLTTAPTLEMLYLPSLRR